jgi:acyl-CoA synthetase (AMP-forming)/AMP-acid ligase II
MYTSGTTGRPKGVVHSQRAVMTNAAHQVAACSLTADDVWLHAAPMFHAFDACYMYALVLCGGTQVMLQGGVFTGADASHAIAARGGATSRGGTRHRCPVHHYLVGSLPPLYITQRTSTWVTCRGPLFSTGFSSRSV